MQFALANCQVTRKGHTESAPGALQICEGRDLPKWQVFIFVRNVCAIKCQDNCIDIDEIIYEVYCFFQCAIGKRLLYSSAGKEQNPHG